MENETEWNTVNDGSVTLIPLEQRAKLKKLFVCKDHHVSSALEALGDFSSLEVLCLAGLGLKSLPPSIWKLKKLKKLFLGGNKLTSLPEEIGELFKLEELHCYRNRLTRLPRSIGKLVKLERFDCYDNGLAGFPSSMGNLTLDLSFGCYSHPSWFHSDVESYFDNPLDPEYEYDSWDPLREHLRNHPDRKPVAARVLRAARAFSSRTCASPDSHSPFTLLPRDMTLTVLGFLDEERLLSEEDVRTIFRIGFERPRAMDQEEFMGMLD